MFHRENYQIFELLHFIPPEKLISISFSKGGRGDNGGNERGLTNVHTVERCTLGTTGASASLLLGLGERGKICPLFFFSGERKATRGRVYRRARARLSLHRDNRRDFSLERLIPPSRGSFLPPPYPVRLFYPFYPNPHPSFVEVEYTRAISSGIFAFSTAYIVWEDICETCTVL